MTKVNKPKLSSAAYVEHGYGYVEPNHLSAQRNGQVYGQLPAAKDIAVLENGQFVSYDYAKGTCTLPTADAPIMMVFNEIKIYDERLADTDFAMVKTDYVARIYDAAGNAMPEGTVMTPRVIRMSVGDLYTTNTVNESTLALNDELGVAADGFLSKAGGVGTLKFKVVKVYTMPDGQRGVKLQCIAE